jgi:4-hydroxy-tetrahydrodipicolinate synthase
MYLYNIPGFAGNAVTASLIARLRPVCPSIVGMKHSDANLVRLQEFQQAGGPDFAIFNGSDAVAMAALTLGARGCVSGNSSAVPEVLLALYRAVRAGDLSAARVEQDRLHEVRALLGDGLNLAAFKTALRLRGIPVGGVRAPHRGLTPEEEARLERGMADFRLRGYVTSQVA